MKHFSDQDLFMLAHRSLAPSSMIAAKWHVLRCRQCRERYRELGSLSVAVASSLRVGLPAWKPVLLGLKGVLALSVIVLAAGALVAEVYVANRPAGGAATCKIADHGVMATPSMAPMPPKHIHTKGAQPGSKPGG
ncbi:MAG TPA: hypothetical protein VMI31_03470 [Fimbriimonadaceae bacterium]|nr:hypothetical protein [Fimbriimonadaceae bacterium]